ncbi:MAG: right-handed parallel beta-helix repeat-containing protein, partial [Actinomycetota bacterium]
MANRLAHHRRTAVAALLLCFVAATMLVTVNGIGVDRQQRTSMSEGVTPVGAGVTHTASSSTEWDTAIAAAAPGDVIRLTATINSRLVYRGDNDGGTATGAAGTAAEPIVITADPGVWVDPGDQNSGFGALDILHVDHVHVVGVNVRNAQFGIRCMQCNGAAGAPIRIADNTVTAIGHAGIHIAGHWSTHAPSSHVLVENNVVSGTGATAAAFGEGIYVGYGSTEWVDVTSDVEISGNDISNTGAEGVDVKPGTRTITVDGNYIHDLAPISGGAISAHYVNATPNPHPSQLDLVTVTGNKIWNLNLADVAGSNDWAIWVGHGGV